MTKRCIYAVSRILLILIGAALIASAADAQQADVQQASPPNRVRVGVCVVARTAAARLICADPNLAARDTKVAAAYRQKKARTPPAAQKELLNEQLTWMRQRDQKCGLVGKDAVPLDELQKVKECMQAQLDARLVELQGTLQTNESSSVPATNALGPAVNTLPGAPATAAAPTRPASAVASASAAPALSQTTATGSPDVVVTTIRQSADAGTTAQSATARQQFRFAAAASHVSGTADCGRIATASAPLSAADAGNGAKILSHIRPVDDANSYLIFEKDAWPSLLDDVRQALHARCIDGSEKAINGLVVGGRITELYEVNSSLGLFVAHSAGLKDGWNVDLNLPRTQQQLQSDLGIQKLIRPSELARNPYFFKDEVVGVIVQLDRKLSEKDAIFARSGAQIFVSGVPHSFTEQQMMVLAGRVVGNKGVVDLSGNEELMPAVDYVGSANCAKACEALAGLAAQ